MISKDALKEISPETPEKVIDLYWSSLNQAMAEFEINTPIRQAAFIAQILHETGGLRYMIELWGPTDTQKRYEGRKDLGNTELGDGKRFRGRGAIQLTGRANYVRYSDLLNENLVENPEIAATPAFAFRIAGAFWKTHGLNELADTGAFKTITRRINGGLNGLVDRLQYYERALEALK